MTRAAVLGLVIAGLLVLCFSTTGTFADPPASPVANGRLLAVPTDVNAQVQQITVIDSQTRVMSVYHVERATGEVTLKSVRNIHWDLQMDEFNGTSPLPREIRALLQKR